MERGQYNGIGLLNSTGNELFFSGFKDIKCQTLQFCRKQLSVFFFQTFQQDSG